MIDRYLTATSRRQPTRARLALSAVMFFLALAPGAQAASMLYIHGAGNGHGIGLSQYGAYGYAQHGWSYQHILGHYYQGTGLRTTNPSQTVRVLLGTGNYGSPTFTAATSAGAPRAGNRTVALTGSQYYSVRAQSGGNVALYDHSGRQLMSVRPPLVVSGPGPVNFYGHGLYRGSLEFRWEYGLHVQTVDAVGLDDYVRGVVSAEMPAGWSTQALNAQAVAARTYAITTSVNGNGYRLYSDTRSQMYRGVSAETSSTDAAVANTRGQVVTLHGTPVVTYFFASSGGHTESIQDAWQGASAEPWLRGVDDSYDDAGGNPYYRWSVSMSMSSATARLGSLVRGSLQGITVTQWGTSPRVVYATVRGSGGSTNVTGDQLQGAFGLMSTYMSFSTISSSAGDSSGGRVRAHVASALFLRGRIAPARRGAVVKLQEMISRRWQPVAARARLSRRGRYAVRVPSPGRYRIVYRGLYGPAVDVG